jgi:23S rRNA (guanosine2251-2'-O)-methyltransferase
MKKSKKEFSVLLWNIRSIHNVGSIFRTADGAGFRKIYLAGITPSPLDHFDRLRPDFAKVALGAEQAVQWEKITRAGPSLKKLKQDGWKICGLEQDKKSIQYSDFSPAPASRICLIVGNEVRGLPPSILKYADKILEIPMRGRKESLNVAVAFGIAAYHLSQDG